MADERIQACCPACGSRSLFIGSGGYLTCAVIECPDPSQAHDVLNLIAQQRTNVLKARAAVAAETAKLAWIDSDLPGPYLSQVAATVESDDGAQITGVET